MIRQIMPQGRPDGARRGRGASAAEGKALELDMQVLHPAVPLRSIRPGDEPYRRRWQYSHRAGLRGTASPDRNKTGPDDSPGPALRVPLHGYGDGPSLARLGDYQLAFSVTPEYAR